MFKGRDYETMGIIRKANKDVGEWKNMKQKKSIEAEKRGSKNPIIVNIKLFGNPMTQTGWSVTQMDHGIRQEIIKESGG